MIAYQIGIFIAIIFSSFFGFGALLYCVISIIAFSCINIFTAPLLVMQLTNIAIATSIGAVISTLRLIIISPSLISNTSESVYNSFDETINTITNSINRIYNKFINLSLEDICSFLKDILYIFLANIIRALIFPIFILTQMLISELLDDFYREIITLIHFILGGGGLLLLPCYIIKPYGKSIRKPLIDILVAFMMMLLSVKLFSYIIGVDMIDTLTFLKDTFVG